jgi:hypothetical protein
VHDPRNESGGVGSLAGEFVFVAVGTGANRSLIPFFVMVRVSVMSNRPTNSHGCVCTQSVILVSIHPSLRKQLGAVGQEFALALPSPSKNRQRAVSFRNWLENKIAAPADLVVITSHQLGCWFPTPVELARHLTAKPLTTALRTHVSRERCLQTGLYDLLVSSAVQVH